MSFEIMPIRGVSNHYGPRAIGGAEGSVTTHDNVRTFGFDGTEENLPTAVHTLQPGTGRVLSVEGTAPTTLTFAGTDVKAATYAAPVAFDANDTNGYDIVFAGTGKCVVRVEFDLA